MFQNWLFSAEIGRRLSGDVSIRVEDAEIIAGNPAILHRKPEGTSNALERHSALNRHPGEDRVIGSSGDWEIGSRAVPG